MNTPLCVVLIRPSRSPQAEETGAYAEALRRLFLGSPSTENASQEGHILGRSELREYRFLAGADTSIETVAAWLLGTSFRAVASQATHLLVVILDGRADPESGAALERSALEEVVLGLIRDAQVPHFAIRSFYTSHATSLWSAGGGDPLRRFGLADLDERDLRQPFLVLQVLHAAASLLVASRVAASATAKPSSSEVRLFFSHAKRDGVPLTTAARDWMKRLKGFASYYDTENLDLDGDISAQLSDAVATSILIVFRSEVFDQRYWCQKEVLWAERHGSPVTLVDARWHLEHAPSVVGFDNMPAVRIPDGSFVRIFTAALREAVRLLLFRARVEEHRAGSGTGGSPIPTAAVAVIPRVPSLVSLHEACQTLDGAPSLPTGRFIVYPNPALPEELLTAVRGLAGGLHAGPTCPPPAVVSLDEFRVLA